MVRGRGASDNEFEALWMALSGKPNAIIAREIGISDIAVRKRLGEVYRKFEIEGRGPGKLGELKQILIAEYQHHKLGDKEPCDVREAPELLDSFYGRTQELKTLEDWILQDCCRLVALFGMTAMGKTALVRYFIESLQERFEFIIWRAIATPPHLDDLLNSLLSYFSPNHSLYTNSEEKIDRLIDYLERYRCLLVLDGIEALLEPQDPDRNYQETYDNYKYFFNQIGAEQHQSCLVITSQEVPKSFQLLERKVSFVRSLVLEKITDEAARQLLSGEQLKKSQAWDELIQTYNQTPLKLKRIAILIQELFNSDVEAFLKATRHSIVLDHLDREVLELQYQRLPECEQSILQYLKLQSKPVSYQEMLQVLSQNYSISKLTESIQYLKNRDGFLEVREKPEIAFTLNPIFKKIIEPKLP